MAGRRRHTDSERAQGERLGAAIAAARRDRGQTQEEVARRTDMALSTLRKIERGGTCDPSFFTIAKIATTVGVSLEALNETSRGQNGG